MVNPRLRMFRGCVVTCSYNESENLHQQRICHCGHVGGLAFPLDGHFGDVFLAHGAEDFTGVERAAHHGAECAGVEEFWGR